MWRCHSKYTLNCHFISYSRNELSLTTFTGCQEWHTAWSSAAVACFFWTIICKNLSCSCGSSSLSAGGIVDLTKLTKTTTKGVSCMFFFFKFPMTRWSRGLHIDSLSVHVLQLQANRLAETESDESCWWKTQKWCCRPPYTNVAGPVYFLSTYT